MKNSTKKYGTTLNRIKDFIFTPNFSIRNVILAIIIGFFIAYGIILSLYGVKNANSILSSLFLSEFKDSTAIASLLNKVVVLGIAGLAIGFGMKVGILNVGVSGQITAGGLIGFHLVSTSQYLQDNKSFTLFIMLFIVIFISSMISMIAGILKVYLKVHEIITMTLLNWIVVYLVKVFADHGIVTPNGLKGSDFFTNGHIWEYTILSLFLLSVTILAVWVLFAKTKTGFKMITISKNKEAAKYAGYNNNKIILGSFATSGALAGLAAYVMFFLSFNKITATDFPIQVGYESIAVALVAMLNPLAIVPSALVFGMLSGPLQGIHIHDLNPNIIFIFSGVITYFVSITTLFFHLKPFQLMRRKMDLWKNVVYKPNKKKKGGARWGH